jgi:2-keto-4-pentenoate hydratase/2-oxohepta-3-ene-1,7-dioic acid hydratase in catechol pathway
MKIARYVHDGLESWGVVKQEQVFPITGDVYGAYQVRNSALPLAEVRLLAPCTPSKAVCIGLNYRDHGKELDMKLPEEPIMFLKPPSSLNHPGGVIEYPAMTKNLHYEAELAVVIGKKAKNVPAVKAHEYILGYTCGNDVTARDVQAKDGQWTRSKSFDTFMPVGPWLETELDPGRVGLKLYLNGQVRQSSTTANLIFPVPHLLAFISQVMTLLPGDVILTGTPAGVGPMQVGDTVVVELEGIGRLTNTVGPQAG